MIRVGLTGSIGSGKSLVARIFETLDVRVFYADKVARELLKDPVIKEAIVRRFGRTILDRDQQIVNQRLATIVFKDPPALESLNGIIHPEVRRRLQEWLADHASELYLIHEAAILFESGFHRECDKVIVVYGPEELRIRRVMERDHICREEVIQRMNNQWTDEEKLKRADFVIVNDGRQMVIPQVLEIHQKLTDKTIWKN
jgi:dephospho-CoA kinase